MARSDTVALYDRIAASYQRWWSPVITPAGLRLLECVAPSVAEAAVARWPHVRVLAIDPSPGMLRVGRAEAAWTLDQSARDRLRWIQGEAEELPLVGGAADVVISAFTLQYLVPRVVALREARRVLRPDGAIAVVTWMRNDWPFEPWRLLAALLDELGLERSPSGEAAGLFRSLPSAAALFRRAGFRDVRATSASVEYEWTLDALAHCTVESEERELFDALDAATRVQLEQLWRERLGRLPVPVLRYRDQIAYVTGRAPIL